MKFTILTLALLVCGTPLFSQGALKSTKVNKYLSLDLPEDFLPMSSAQALQKYVSNNQPVAMYSSLDNKTDLGISSTSTNWGSDLFILKELYKASIMNLYDKVVFEQEFIQNINDREFIVFEFVGTVLANDNGFQNQRGLTKYVYICYTPYQDKIMVFNFSTEGFLKDRWETVANGMMKSIKLK